MMKQRESFFKVQPFSNMYTGYEVLKQIRNQKCFKMATQKFDQKCLKDNLWRDDYNFTLIQKEYEAIDKAVETALSIIKITPVIYDEIEQFSNNNSYPFKERKISLPQHPGIGFKIELQQTKICLDQDLWAEFIVWQDSKCDITNP